MDIEKLMTSMFAGGLGNMLKKPVIVTDRYISENYLESQVIVIDNPDTFSPNCIDIYEVKVIILRGCNLEFIPEWIYIFRNIEGLIFDNNPKLHLTDSFKEFSNLKVLGLQQTNITDYNFIESFNHIESLDISGNGLEEYPREICSLKKLLYLDISTYNTFTKIPKCIINNQKLRVLRAHFNKIENIPEEIGELINLEQLILGSNKIKYVPETIYKLKKLKELDLFQNDISQINFKALSKLDDLDEIFLADNPIKDFPENLVSQNKGIISSLALKKYYETGHYYEISNTISNDALQRSRLLRSARAIIFRGLFLGLRKEWKTAYKLVYGGYTLARKLNHNKLSILAGVFLGYFEVMKEVNPDYEVFIEATNWAKKINDFWNPYEDKKDRDLFNICLIKYSFLTEQNITYSYREEEDFELLLAKIFDNNYDIIKIDEEDELTHCMLQGVSSDSHPTKIENTRNDLNNRDLLRAYIELNLFDDAWKELARQHSLKHDPFPITSNFPVINSEFFIYIFQLTNRDKIRIVVTTYQSDIILFELDSISIDINMITTSLMISEFSLDLLETLNSNNMSIDENIWKTIFGAYIISKKVNGGDKIDMTSQAITFHEYFIDEKIKKLSIFSFASLLGIPFYSSFNKDENKALIDYYEVTNRPMFIVKDDVDKVNYKNIIVTTHEDLLFANAESMLISKYNKNTKILKNSNKDYIFNLLESNNIIHMACHSKESDIILKINANEFSITPSEIKKLNLTKCSLVFLNACRTSEEAYVSLINTSSLPLAFLEAGVSTVITTTREIHDKDAFRISTRFYELLSKVTNYNYSAIFRDVLLEAKEDMLSYYDDSLESIGELDLASNMKYIKKYGAKKTISSWKYYTIWENNYEK